MTKRTSEGATLRFFRFALGLTEEEVGAQNGVSPTLIKRYELDDKTLFRERLGELLAPFDVPPEAIDHALLGLQLARSQEETGSPVDPVGVERRLIRRATAAVGGSVSRATEAELTARTRRRRAKEARRWAAGQWEQMKKLSLADCRLIIDTLDDERTWALAERLGRASADAAAHRADQALELAQLAMRAAGRIPEGPWRSLNEGISWAFYGNACRVAGALPAAREAFCTSDELWKAGEGGDPAGLLDGSRRLDLKATLYRYDGKIEEALALLEQARTAARTETARARILLKKANTLELAGAYDDALVVLQQAESHIEAQGEPRLRFLLLFSRAANLLRLDRFAEAQELLPQVRNLAVELGNQLELTRVLWLNAKIGVGFGRLVEARATLEQVRRVFEEQRIAYDYALVSLELALLHLEEGRTVEVAKLAEEMWWIFKDQGVHKEALAALKLFCEAARKQQADAGWVRRMITYLYRAQISPNLRFEP